MDDILARVKTLGLPSASAADLLAIGLASREQDIALTDEAARNMLKGAESLRRLMSLSVAELMAEGMSEHDALRCLAWLELGRKVGLAGRGNVYTIDCPEAAAQEFLRRLSDEKKEYFGALFLDSKGRLLRASIIHIGTVNMSVVGPREVFREAIREGAASVIVVHNHPSGDPEPSPEDIDVTRKLANLGRELDIPVLDHIIVGGDELVSLRQRGVVS